MTGVGVVVIGRNEGPRLARCLDSVCGRGMPVIYADSGSTDGSVELARSRGAAVIELDDSMPFTAARGRNAGLSHLLKIDATVDLVQFVDGDCEIAADWIDQAAQALRADPALGAVRGQLREKSRAASIYGRLCDMEWRRPAGEISSCGGIAMMRISAFRQVGGFDQAIAAGEENDLCRRLRSAQYKVCCIDAPMGVHDAGMTRFGQWWNRTVRSGRSYAQGTALEANDKGRPNLHAVRSIFAWGLLLPLLLLGLAWPTRGLSLMLFGAYVVLWFRIRRGSVLAGNTVDDAGLYATFCIIGKFAQVYGVGRYLLGRSYRFH